MAGHGMTVIIMDA